MKRIVVSLAALVLIVSAGIIHGRWTNRWQLSEEMALAVERLGELDAKIGKTLGPWEGEPGEIADRVKAFAGIEANFVVNYRNSGEAIAAFLVCGKHGPISAHLPQMCYESQGFNMTTEPKRFELKRAGGLEAAEFQQAKFRKDDVNRQTLRIYWTFGAGGKWLSPENPRFELAGNPVVYKLYVIHETSQGEDQAVARQFIKDLLNELDAVLFPANDQPMQTVATTGKD